MVCVRVGRKAVWKIKVRDETGESRSIQVKQVSVGRIRNFHLQSPSSQAVRIYGSVPSQLCVRVYNVI